MPTSLNNYTTQANYTDAGTINSTGGVRIRLQVSGAAILWRWASSRTLDWNEEEMLLPGLYSFQADITAAQVKDFVAGTHANVTMTILYRDDLVGS